MMQGMIKESILHMGCDKMILRHVHDKPFTIRFPDRSEVNGKRGFNPRERGGTNLAYRWYQDKKRHWSWGVWL
jgi:hypothetical protein